LPERGDIGKVERGEKRKIQKYSHIRKIEGSSNKKKQKKGGIEYRGTCLRGRKIRRPPNA